MRRRIIQQGFNEFMPYKVTTEEPKFILLLAQKELLFTPCFSPNDCLLTSLLPGFGRRNWASVTQTLFFLSLWSCLCIFPASPCSKSYRAGTPTWEASCSSTTVTGWGSPCAGGSPLGHALSIETATSSYCAFRND